MKKEKRTIPVYKDGNIEIRKEMTVLVDNHGEGWLKPEQVENLESQYIMIRNSNNSLVMSDGFSQPLYYQKFDAIQQSSDYDKTVIRPIIGEYCWISPSNAP